jgi:hypothetical protein
LMSVEMVFNRLSNVHLLGIDTDHRLLLIYGYTDSSSR